MKILISGYGKMGREIEAAIPQRGHTIAGIFDNTSDWENNASILNQADVVIDFSIPEVAADNIFRCLDAEIPVVCGTTAWIDRLPAITERCRKKRGSLFYAPNFSIGVNILFEINKRLAQLMNQHPEFEVSIEETHHVKKLDAPSGTAIALTEGMLTMLQTKKGWCKSPDIEEGKIPVTSIREGDIPGIHKVIYSSQNEELSLIHHAFSRQGFALGAITAAEWVINKKGIFTMRDLLQL
ncbi:MAG: 4-hydroxy-tetrahydrodipicolinate reductase [Bacteroidales bacterium]|jgi:4-hydroxy-tetrahydrodipicolinate reductase|nr:4-hydroxy-tetrahydrodipicolinate reductase [Bacteroidales bacterium]